MYEESIIGKVKVDKMIFDLIENAKLYYGMGDRIAAGLKLLETQDFSDAKPGRYDVDGDNLYYMVQEYAAKPQDMGKWETHRRYIDIQYVVDGRERIGYVPIKNLTVSEKYDADRDIMFLEGEGNFIKAGSGCFAIFMPDDAHMPCIEDKKPCQVKKIVVKVLI